MVFLYSRPGQRVLVNSRGDMIVRPSWVEASLQRLPGGTFTTYRIRGSGWLKHGPQLHDNLLVMVPCATIVSAVLAAEHHAELHGLQRDPVGPSNALFLQACIAFGAVVATIVITQHQQQSDLYIPAVIR